MPVDIDVKVTVDKDGKTQITFDKKALMEAPLSQLINDTSTSVQVFRAGQQTPQKKRKDNER